MMALLVLLLLVLIGPPCSRRWPLTVAGLGLQGLIMGLLVLAAAPAAATPLISLADLWLVRGVLLPILLYRALRTAENGSAGDGSIHSMMRYLGIGCLIALGFLVALRLEPDAGEHQLRLAVCAVGLLLGLYQLASTRQIVFQVSGALYIENAIALFEIDRAEYALPLSVQLGLLGVLVLSVLVFGSKRLSPPPGPRPPRGAYL